MEMCFLMIIFLIPCLILFAVFLKSIFQHCFSHFKITNQKLPLPPNPFIIPIIGNFLWLLFVLFRLELDPIIRSFHAKLGPVITIHVATSPSIFIADGSLAHHALIRNGAVFADRPHVLALQKINGGSDQHNITSSRYGPTWRLLRRNLTSQFLNTLNVKSYSPARKWVLQMLQDRIESESISKSNHYPVNIMGCFQHAMFCLLVCMCFGEKIDEEIITRIERVRRRLILSARKFKVLSLWPAVTKILLHKSWQFYSQLRKEQEDMLIPLIRRARKKGIEQGNGVVSNVHTLFSLVLPDENRKLDDGQILTLCSEFFNAGTDTTSTALQWIMANLVKCARIQKKLVEEMKSVILENAENITEEDLKKMTYLKAIVLEGLRRHPPSHFVLPHEATQNVVVSDKYRIPKNSTVNFMVSEIGWDPKVWKDPMEFKPERFLNRGEEGLVFDITGSREIKMMPFGAGRRMCPAYGLAMLHLEYFVVHLVWKFEWKAVDGEEDGVDLTEKEEFTSVMKNPLRAKNFVNVVLTLVHKNK